MWLDSITVEMATADIRKAGERLNDAKIGEGEVVLGILDPKLQALWAILGTKRQELKRAELKIAATTIERAGQAGDKDITAEQYQEISRMILGAMHSKGAVEVLDEVFWHSVNDQFLDKLDPKKYPALGIRRGWQIVSMPQENNAPPDGIMIIMGGR